MERAKQLLEVSEEESRNVLEIVVKPIKAQMGPNFYDVFSLAGIRVDRIGPGMIDCTFKVPPRLTDRNGNMAVGAIANIIDMIGIALIHRVGQPLSMSVTMSISYLSSAKLDDELEVSSRLVGKIGPVTGTSIMIKNKGTGDVVAEGRHSLISKL